MKPVVRWILMGLGFVFVGLGIAGVFLPVVPTVPFLIAAAWCFSKSSPRWHAWLLAQPRFGPLIKDWEDHGIVGRKTKITASVMLLPLLAYPVFFKTLRLGFKIAMVSIALSVIVFLWTRPEASRS